MLFMVKNSPTAIVNHIMGLQECLQLPALTIATGVVAVILAAAVVNVVNRRDPLYDIPGPFLARWTSLWLAYHARMGRRYLAIDRLHKKYGKLVRIAPTHISVADHKELDVIYGQGAQAFNKSQFYDAFVSGAPSVFSTTDRQEHARKRKLLSRAFSSESLQKCVFYNIEVISVFVQKLDGLCELDQDIDALAWFNYLAFDILSNLAFGEPIGMVSKGSDVVTLRRINGTDNHEHAITLVNEREHLSAVVGLHPVLKSLWRFIPDPFFIRGRQSSIGLTNLARNQVMKRLAVPSQREDILTRLIEAYCGEGQRLSEEQVTELTAEAVTLLIAGSDTTSSSMTVIVYLTLMHRKAYLTLLNALEEIAGETIPNYDTVKNIPYLDAIIHEGLRYHAITAIGLHRTVPQDGAVCCGRYFPAGTEMSIPAWTIQHDPDIWGDPEVFRPERWLESENLKPYLLTFGKGPRACLGRNLAYMEMRVVLATFFLRYEIELKTKAMRTHEGFMHKPLELMVGLRRRIQGCRE